MRIEQFFCRLRALVVSTYDFRSPSHLHVPVAFWILYLVQRLHSIRPKRKRISQETWALQTERTSVTYSWPHDVPSIPSPVSMLKCWICKTKELRRKKSSWRMLLPKKCEILHWEILMSERLSEDVFRVLVHSNAPFTVKGVLDLFLNSLWSIILPVQLNHRLVYQVFVPASYCIHCSKAEVPGSRLSSSAAKPGRKSGNQKNTHRISMPWRFLPLVHLALQAPSFLHWPKMSSLSTAQRTSVKL